jgi:hypothetical protein
MIDPKRLRPGEVCRLVNSTPLGEVLTQAKLRVHRNRAGMSELPIAEKARLTIALGDALSRAINMDELENRLEALEQVIGERKEKKR